MSEEKACAGLAPLPISPLPGEGPPGKGSRDQLDLTMVNFRGQQLRDVHMEQGKHSSTTCLASEYAQRVIALEFHTRWSPISEAMVLGAEDKGFELFAGLPIRADCSPDLEVQADAARDVLARQRPVSVAGANCMLLAMFRDLRGERGSTYRLCKSAEGLSASVSAWSADRIHATSGELIELAMWLANRLLHDAALPETGPCQEYLQATVSSLSAVTQPADLKPVAGLKLLDEAVGAGAAFLLSRHSAIAGMGLQPPVLEALPDDPDRPFGKMARQVI